MHSSEGSKMVSLAVPASGPLALVAEQRASQQDRSPGPSA
jgi:hypothetical protein